MPDILTRGDSELKPCPLQGHEPLGTSDSFGPGPYVSVSGAPGAIQFYGVVCPGCCSTAYCASRERAVKLWNTRSDGRLKENGLSASENALERDSAQSSPIPANSVNDPETIRISLPALRSVILAAIDDGDEASDKASGVIFRLPWPIDHPWADVANDARMRFCDEIERRLRQLPARG